ncbi:hypothetical protein C5167_013501 [Papaver somniferum]|uniref:Uncharacterized protein n=1 Tax=Papaver somniferum TaxID=3469 RepID=A0A4Y7J4H4_PAPSO|nr:protein SHORT HYPOCOTYL IN WHITE LIGHT 1-like [Papaver somniferum]RZC54648.1 hypothetical protein C5167_013501 [Papaver somniferum]
MASSVNLCRPTYLYCNPGKKFLSNGQNPIARFPVQRFPCHLQASSRRSSNYPQDGESAIVNPRNWNNISIGDFNYDDNDDESDEEDGDRSLDLLVRFVQNVFRKVSKRARKAVRSVLPMSLSTKLVGFSVNGVIILTFLWVLKAFLEVICTLGTVIFVSILFIRGVWSGISYIQENRNSKTNVFGSDSGIWSGAAPAS